MFEPKRDALEDMCRRFHVRRQEVFGSAATDGFEPDRSDLDFLVQFQPDAENSRADGYFGLLFGLQELFGRPVDLVEPDAIRNRFFRRAVDQTSTLLYAA